VCRGKMGTLLAGEKVACFPPVVVQLTITPGSGPIVSDGQTSSFKIRVASRGSSGGRTALRAAA
jgi:hypothetical protein